MIFSASLRVRHPTWSVERVCKYVGLEPKFAHDLGKQRKTPDGKLLDGFYELTYVSFSLYSGAEISFADFFDSMIRHGPLKDKNFDALWKSGGAVEILLGASIEGNEWWPIAISHLEYLSKTRLELLFDVYASDP